MFADTELPLVFLFWTQCTVLIGRAFKKVSFWIQNCKTLERFDKTLYPLCASHSSCRGVPAATSLSEVIHTDTAAATVSAPPGASSGIPKPNELCWSLPADVAVQTTSKGSNPGGILTRCHGRLLALSLPSSRLWRELSPPVEKTLFFLLDLFNALIKAYASYSNLDFPFDQHCTSCQWLYSLVNKVIS